MPKKLLSLLTVLAFVFSLIRIMPVRAEEYVEAKADKITNGVSESRMINGLTEEDWLRIMEEQEKLMTPEIRASIRENAMKSLEGKSFKNGDFAMKNAKPSDYGFKTQAEFDKWLNSPLDLLKSTSSTDFYISPEAYALRVGSRLTVNAYGYTNPYALHWFDAGDKCISITATGGTATVTGTAPGNAFAVVTDHAQSPIAQLGCAVEVISFNITNDSVMFMRKGDTCTVNTTTSHSDPHIAIRSDSPDSISISGNTFTIVDNTKHCMFNVYVYLVDRPTVVDAICVELLDYHEPQPEQPEITLTFPEGMYYYGQPIPITVETTPANADITWSVMPENAGYFVGNTFYPQKADRIYLRASMNGTTATADKTIEVLQRTITLNTTNIERTTIQGGFFIDVSISHGSLYELQYEISNSDVINEITYIAGQPYVTLKKAGDAAITITAPGSNSVVLNVHVPPTFQFLTFPEKMYTGSDYTIKFYSDSMVEPIVTLDAVSTSSGVSSDYTNPVETSNNFYQFVVHAKDVNDRFNITISTYFRINRRLTEYIIRKEYTVFECERGIIRSSPANQFVCNEDTDINNQITVRFDTYMTVDNIRQSVNSGVKYEINDSDGISCSMNGSVLTITPTRVDHNLEGLYPNYTAHKTGTITIEASLRDLPSKSILYYVTVSCDDAFVPGDIGASGMYQLVPNEDVSRFSESGLFTHAFTMLGVNIGFGGNVGRGIGICPQMNFFNSIRNSRVFAIHSHGNIGSMLINCKDNISATSDQIRALHNGYFNSTDLIISLTCYGANTDHGNGSILDAFRDKGVSCTIGFGDSVYSEVAQKFEQAFYKQIINNSSEYATINDVFDSLENDFGADIYGNCSINFN